MRVDTSREHSGGAPSEATPRVRAVTYARVSTDLQQYSVENQCEAMREYAARHGLEIVRAYTDDGKSGLRIDGRDALQRLLDEVQRPDRDFGAILVYDVSRWGRFQDPDESAFYEHVCRRAGVPVHFCAEPFANDGSTASAIVKAMKRAMAGEYSRELSQKVFQGQCRLIRLGFHQGGASGYALERVLLDQDGTVKGVLARGERKSLQTDRVVLRPGPPEEVAVVQWIFEQFVEQGRSRYAIARLLNARGLRTHRGVPWCWATVHAVLTNERYIGTSTYARVDCKLRQGRVRNPPEQHVRAEGAFAPTIDPALFARAQAVLAARAFRLSDAHLLECLRQLLTQQGRLSSEVINRAGGPHSKLYERRFGSLLRAYQLVGYVPERNYHYLGLARRRRAFRKQLVADLTRAMAAAGASVVPDARPGALLVNGELRVAVEVARCFALSGGELRWVLQISPLLCPDLLVLARPDPEHRLLLDYYLLPAALVPAKWLRLAEHNGQRLDAFRTDSLDALLALVRRTPIKEGC